jgi:hypothetical protein
MHAKIDRQSKTDRRGFLQRVGAVGAAAGTLPFSDTAFAAENRVSAKKTGRSERTSQTAAALRDLWVGHIFWVRNVSLAALSNNDAAMKAAEQQAVGNAQSIAAAVEPFYGAAAQASFFKLLAGHYSAVKAYLLAAVEDSVSAQEAATQSLSSNAEEIAIFLSKANPHLSKDGLHGLLLAHGGHHIQQIQQLKGHEYDAEARTWESMKKHIYEIADATADALAKQFASRFR